MSVTNTTEDQVPYVPASKNIELIKTIKRSTLDDLNFMITKSKEEISNSTNLINSLTERNQFIKTDLLKLGEVKKLLIKLKNSKMIDKKDFILNTINTALSDVFLDQEVKIDLVAANSNSEASKLNIKYDIVLYQNGLEMARNDKMLSKNGGGILSFISILFKILVGYIYSKNKFYVFDESLAEVSEIYLPRISQFLQKFCEKHKFTIILITHSIAAAEFADLVYKLDGEFEDGIPLLKIENVDGDYPKENYIYNKIENFQSIKKLEFRYKGFTAIIGKNNIGKSASFRAINSIIFNNFDMKEFPRMTSAEKPDKLLPTKIEFGLFHTKDNPLNEDTKILMYKKGQSLIYEFNGDTYVGKNLAFEKVKEKIESIGFRYLNLKDQYKNFKGNLKEQTERLAVTTQQDTYYLIGGKTADTSKVFDFLFDSREVSMAIINLNTDILNMENELNQNTVKISSENNFINTSNLKIKLMNNNYLVKIIEKFISVNYDVRDIEIEYSILKKNDAVLGKLINGLTLMYSLNSNIRLRDDCEHRIVKLKNRTELYSKLITTLTNIGLIVYYNDCLIAIDKLNKFHSLTTTKLKVLFINYYQNLILMKNTVSKKELSTHKKLSVLTKLLKTTQELQFLDNYMFQYDKKIYSEKRIGFLNKKVDTLTKYVSSINNIFSIKNIISNINSLKDYIISLDHYKYHKINQLEMANKCIKINDINDLINKMSFIKRDIDTLTSTYYQKQERIKNLHLEFKLEPCKICSGLGFHNH